MIDDRIKRRIVTAVRRCARVRHRSWLEKTPGGTTTIERACPILSDLKEDGARPAIGMQGFNDAVEIDDERFPALL